MPTVLSVANQKGGVGKTTTATSLAHGLGLAGRSVLLVDLDPQGNATSGVGAEVVDRSPAFATDASQPAATNWRGVAILPAGRDLDALAGRVRPTALSESLARGPASDYDVAILDCPPSLGPLTRNALLASDAVVVPIQCEYYPLEGLVQLLSAVQGAADENPRLSVGGVLLTMFDPEVPLSREVEDEVRGKLTERVFDAVVPRDAAVAEAPSHCRSVLDYAPRSRGARAYADLTIEVLDALVDGKET